MLSRVRFLKRFALDLPKRARLAYCLMRDPRESRRTKAAFAAAMGVIVTPFIDLPSVIPFVGEIDMLALTLLAMRLFIAACPDGAVADVQQQILEGRSVFDEDLRNGERFATMIARRFSHEEPESHRAEFEQPERRAEAETATGVGV